METMTATEVIAKSAARDQIITVDAGDIDIEALRTAATNWVENGHVTEYWGRDEEGDTWRVHVLNSLLA